MHSDSDYIQAHRHETFIDHKPLGVKIFVAIGREPTEEEKSVIWRAGDMVYNSLWKGHVMADPKALCAAAKEKEGILKLFEGKNIFVEEIPNGYCNQPCCCHRPWFIVTTPIGHIQIGWRKRVINIDWTRTLQKKTGIELFPDEDVTKGGPLDKEHYIHAWGYEKAKEYLDIIHKDVPIICG